MRNATWIAGRKWMLGLALTAGLLGTGLAANAAQDFHQQRDRFHNGEFGREGDRRYEVRHDNRYEARRDYRVGGRYYGGAVVENYIPPCPGAGYTWVAGYYNGGLWIPGSWVFRGNGYVGGYGYGFHRGWDRERHYDRDDRHFDGRGDRGRGFEREHGRGNEYRERR